MTPFKNIVAVNHLTVKTKKGKQGINRVFKIKVQYYKTFFFFINLNETLT